MQGYYHRVGSSTPIKEVEFDEYIAMVRSELFKDDMITVRAEKERLIREYGDITLPEAKEKYQEVKRTTCRVFTITATFGSHRRIADLKEMSGYMALDFDMPENDGVSFDELATDPYIVALHESIGGGGAMVGFIRIDKRLNYRQLFEGAKRYFVNKYGAIVDDNTKDITRARYASHDPNVYYNMNAKTFRDAYKEITAKEYARLENIVVTDSDIEYILKQAQENRSGMTEDYSDWVYLGLALATHYKNNPIEGRNLWHEFSKLSLKYDAKVCDDKWMNFMRTNRESLDIETIKQLASKHGLKLQSPETKAVANLTKIRMRGNVSKDSISDSVKETLALQGVEHPNMDEVIEQTKNKRTYAIDSDSLDDVLTEYLLEHNITRSAIGGTIYVDGKALSDQIVNDLYLDAKRDVSGKIKKNMVTDIIYSSRVPEFNPFDDFVDANRHHNTNGHVDELLACFDLEVPDMKLFMHKWFVSIIASTQGVHSELVLVLSGYQGSFKTKFFRGLLPEALSHFHTDDGIKFGDKDNEILICNKLLVIDDEFGSMKKNEYEAFKKLTSKREYSIRTPYGKIANDMKRLAVFGGTSNEKGIISDITGNRRIISVWVNRIDQERYKKINKDALYMELYRQYKADPEGWMLTAEDIELLGSLSIGQTRETREEELVVRYLEEGDEEMSATDVAVYLKEVTKIEVHSMIMGKVLSKVFGAPKVSIINGKTKRVYNLNKINHES